MCVRQEAVFVTGYFFYPPGEKKMVETRMDAMIARLAPQPQTIANRPKVQAGEQVLKARPAEAAGSVEADIARIFARRAFQATPALEKPALVHNEGPRGGNLDILA